MLQRMRTWWQVRTGTEETPFDGDIPAWLISLAIHLGLLIMLTWMLRELPIHDDQIELVTSMVEPDVEVPQEFFFSEIEKTEVGANSVEGTEMADSMAEVEAELTEQATPEKEITAPSIAPTATVINNVMNTDFAWKSMPNVAVQGAAGIGTTGAEGAIDRITQEIIDSLEDRKTLVVWIFDRSVSLSAQRASIVRRLDRIYEQLGVIEASGDPRFARHHEKPLLSAVVGFGQEVSFHLKKPTDQVSQIKAAVEGIQADDSGKEFVFNAVHMAAERYKSYAVSAERRNVMLVVFTDEAGDDAVPMIDRTVAICQRFSMPVYVVGVPAPFGRREVEVKWVDPDPKFDQTPQWTPVTHGPETMYAERIKLSFSGVTSREEPLDSGFGPFALTRLAVDTGGIYFSVHPNRNPDRPVRKSETAHLSAYIRHFFDADKMRRYRPDYVSVQEFERTLQKNKAKMSLVRAARMSWTAPMVAPLLRFPKRSDAELANSLTTAQQQAAKLLEGTLVQIYNELQKGEKDRPDIVQPRWKAGYDLAMGRTLAVKVRTLGYNHMLAAAKRGMKFKEERNDTWVLAPSDKVLTGSAIEKDAERARMYLKRVVEDHRDTPWALLAARELEDPLGWEWKEEFSNVNPPPRPRAGNNNPNPPRPNDDRPQMIPRPVRRPPPKI